MKFCMCEVIFAVFTKLKCITKLKSNVAILCMDTVGFAVPVTYECH